MSKMSRVFSHNCMEEGKDQESIQTKSTSDPGRHMGSEKTEEENITYKRDKRSILSQQVTTRLQGTDKIV